MTSAVLLLGLTAALLSSTASAQTPSSPAGSGSGAANSAGGKGANPPGTPSWGSERMPDRKNPSSPTAPCPAGTSRQNLGQDCHPLDKGDQKSKK